MAKEKATPVVVLSPRRLEQCADIFGILSYLLLEELSVHPGLLGCLMLCFSVVLNIHASRVAG